MKSIIVLALFFFVSSEMLLAQHSVTPFKGAEKIIVKYNAASDSLFNVLAKQVKLHGYTIDRQEKDSMLITTDFKLIKRHCKYAMRLAIEDSSLTISSTCMVADLKIGFKNGQYVPLVYYPKGYHSQMMFKELLAFVKATGPVSIAYAK